MFPMIVLMQNGERYKMLVGFRSLILQNELFLALPVTEQHVYLFEILSFGCVADTNFYFFLFFLQFNLQKKLCIGF